MVGIAREPTRFDIHSYLLASASPLFTKPTGLPRKITRPIHVPGFAFIFRMICTWLYERAPPVFDKPKDLTNMMMLWVALGKLGMWEKQNTILRLATALMQPKEFVCERMAVLRAYVGTRRNSKLRGFIIALLCQRPPSPAEVFALPPHILRDVVDFMHVLNRARMANPKGKDGYNLKRHAHFTFRFQLDDEEEKEGRVMETLIFGNSKVDWSKIEYPLPSFLIWDEEWEDMPDRYFFVDAETVFEAAQKVQEQLESM
jgi:hypothetical protein